MSYKFYYDEAFHDRKVKLTRKEKINIHGNNISDIYVGAFIGVNKIVEDEIENKFKIFENKQKNIYSLDENQELKGTINKKKNFKKGISTFNANCLNFYHDFFSIFDEDIIIHISLLSKTAMIFNEIFSTDLLPDKVKKSAFIYSIIKFMHNYRCQDLFLNLFEDTDELSNSDILIPLKDYLNKVIDYSCKSKRKRKEVKTLKEIIYILDNSQIDLTLKKEYLWDYDEIFIGFNKLLKERKIDSQNVELFIDNEDRTKKSAIKIGSFKNVKDCDSKKENLIRVSDILSNFLGRLILALDDDLDEKKLESLEDIEKYDFDTKKILSQDWFSLTNKEFDLYKIISKIFSEYNRYYWTGYSSVYFDYPVLLFSFINYFSLYSSFEEFKNIVPQDHSERFNTFSGEILLDKFKKF